MDPALRERIQGLIDSDQVVLFMKGTRTMPQCGFSATVVQILDELVETYTTVNVLADADVRQAIKDFSDWPTIPQLYLKGEFVGGCDIVKDMYANGQLEESLGVRAREIPTPKITISDDAAEAFRGALQASDEFVRLEIDSHFNHGLSIGPRGARDVEVDAGPLKLLLDRASAKRADGVSIRYVDTPNGKAFKIDNPNEPLGVQDLSPKRLQELLAAGPVELFDVRTVKEREIAAITPSRLLDRTVQDYIFGLPKDTPLHFYCHTGVRSRQAAEFFLNQGFTQVWNLEGGIDAWSRDVDPEVPRY